MAILLIAQIVVSVLLITAILLQQQSAGLGGAFGGDSGWHHTKRGFEKGLFIGTIVLASIFLILSLLQLFIR